MMMVQEFRALREAIPETFKRGTIHPLSLEVSQSFGEVLGSGLFIYLISWVFLACFSIESPGTTASSISFFAACFFWIYPFLSLVRITRGEGLNLRPKVLGFYSAARQIIACFALTFVLGNVLIETADWVYSLVQQSRKNERDTQRNPALLPKKTHHLWRQDRVSSFFPFTSTQMILIGWPFSSLALFMLMLMASRKKEGKTKKQNHLTNTKRRALADSAAAVSPADSLPFRLWLGKSTGKLGTLWHPAHLAPNQHIGLTLQDAAQNIVILGAIGSGKTTKAMHPLLVQLLDQDCGGLIFDIKGDFKKAVFLFASLTNKKPVLVGVNEHPLNLLEGLSPEMAASFLKSALLLAGNTKSDLFWIDTAVELCRNLLGILSFVPEHYHLNGLYRYLFDQSFQKEREDQLNLLKGLGAFEERLLKTYQQYLSSIFASFDEKIKSGVLANIAQILSPFQHPDLIDAFCTKEQQGEEASFLKEILKGTIYVIDIPLSRWGLAGKVIYTLIKLRFFNLMQQRVLHSDWNQDRPVFFMCDEYQEIVSCNKDGLSDLNFWDKSRSSQTIGILSAQSVSSFYAAIGDRDLVHALLQNFRQKLVFRVEDDWTISYCNRLLGQVETQKIIHSTGSTRSEGQAGSSRSSSQSVHYQQKEVIDGQLFRTMESNQVLALLSLNGEAADDLLTMKQVFMPEKDKPEERKREDEEEIGQEKPFFDNNISIADNEKEKASKQNALKAEEPLIS